jgi:hypothetical protein
VDAAIILLALGAATGFALGTSSSGIAILISGAAFAVLSSAALHLAGFGALSEISFIVACLTVNQMAYLIGIAFAPMGSLTMHPPPP